MIFGKYRQYFKGLCLNFQAKGAENLATKPLPRPNFTTQ